MLDLSSESENIDVLVRRTMLDLPSESENINVLIIEDHAGPPI
jgi:hypothetical protein